MQRVPARELRLGAFRRRRGGVLAGRPGILEPFLPGTKQTDLEEDTRIAGTEREGGFELRRRRLELPQFGVESSQIVTRLEGAGVGLHGLGQGRKAVRSAFLPYVEGSQRSQYLRSPRIFGTEFLESGGRLLQLALPAEQDGQIPPRLRVTRVPFERLAQCGRRFR